LSFLKYFASNLSLEPLHHLLSSNFFFLFQTLKCVLVAVRSCACKPSAALLTFQPKKSTGKFWRVYFWKDE
jgi:hypothetical protein